MTETVDFFCGYAKVSLGQLDFHSPLFASKPFNPSRAESLAKTFLQVSCAREERGNFISAIIDSDTLEQAVTQSRTTLELLKRETEIPHLSLPEGYRLRCLYGKHRARAAECLPTDHWWTVSLYYDSMPDRLQRQLCIQSDTEFGPGELFRNLEYSRLMSGSEVALWENKLSRRSRQDLASLKRRYPMVLDALDNLLPFPGLWTPFTFYFLRRLKEIGCPREITGYLNRIYHTWTGLFEGMAGMVDSQSVKLIENLVPQMSSIDRDTVISMMETGILFPSLYDQDARTSLLSRLLNLSGRILSLYSLVQDTLLWHPCAQALRQLVPGPCRDLRRALLLQFHGIGEELVIQVAENAVETIKLGAGVVSQAEMVAYIQLWLFAVRYVESLTHTNLPGSTSERSAEAYSLRLTRRESSHMLAVLAKQLGFKSHEINSLRGDSTITPNARAYLITRRPPNQYVHSNHWDHQAADQIAQLLEAPEPRSSCKVVVPPITTDSLEKVKRCGLPAIRSHLRDRESTYIPHIYGPDQPEGRNITSFAILRDMIFAFFGHGTFPSGMCPWWSKDGLAPNENHDQYQAQLPNQDVEVIGRSDSVDLGPHHHVRQQDQNHAQDEEMINSDPVDLEPHPSGTPDRDITSIIQTGEDMNPQLTLTTTPPIAPGFEDSSRIAPLNKTTFISHHRSFDEIIREWGNHWQTSPAVVYLFKTREYRKFDISDPAFDRQVTEFVNSIANNHLFIGMGGMLTPEEVLPAIRSLPIILACTDPEHYSVQYRMEQYVSIFDPKTGKRGMDSPHIPNQKLLKHGRSLKNRESSSEESIT
ncbi:hypothetical protein BJX64DRAFT_264634 [Aspergillus heterothallicus]